MFDVESYRLNAEQCLHQASVEDSPEDKNILLNVALAWLRLAQQTETLAGAEELAVNQDVDPTHDEATA
jgi:hypothetical protein